MGWGGRQLRRLGATDREGISLCYEKYKQILSFYNDSFFHFFSYAPYINKLVIFRILSSFLYHINYCFVDTYEFVSKCARQKGKILPNSTLITYRQNSKMIKILYIKMRFKVMGDMIYISYRDRVTDGQRQGRGREDMMNSRYRDRVTDGQ